MADSSEAESESSGYLTNIFMEIVTNPLNIILVSVIMLLVYKIYKSRHGPPAEYTPREPEIPKLRKDFTLEELKEHNGTGADGRILIAVNGKVFDVTTKGRRFYGPGGTYSAFGGRDASRGLATFSINSGKDEYDDLSDLNSTEMDSVREWEEQFREKYDYVGRLLKPGEKHTNYSDEEEETSNVSQTSAVASTEDAQQPQESNQEKSKDE